MSYLGCIGYFMSHSGIEEILSVIYAPKSVEKILNGHAYARAVRAHTLLQVALASFVFLEIDLMDEEEELVQSLSHNIPSLKYVNECAVLKGIFQKMECALIRLADQSPTAKLWVQYFNQVTLMRNFIAAERMANWLLDLKCVRNMLPYFHSAGHFLYAKGAHLYTSKRWQSWRHYWMQRNFNGSKTKVITP